MSLFVHQGRRYPVFLIKASAFDVKLIGPFLRILGQLPGAAARRTPRVCSWRPSGP